MRERPLGPRPRSEAGGGPGPGQSAAAGTAAHAIKNARTSNKGLIRGGPVATCGCRDLARLGQGGLAKGKTRGFVGAAPRGQRGSATAAPGPQPGDGARRHRHFL